MTTTELIKLLKENEFGGATGRPREVYICVGDNVFETDIESVDVGDGLFTELFLTVRGEDHE